MDLSVISSLVNNKAELLATVRARDALVHTAKRRRDGLPDGKIPWWSPRRLENEVPIGLVEALSRSLKPHTLKLIVNARMEMHQPAPRGRLKWCESSIRYVLDQAQGQGLVGEAVRTDAVLGP